MKTFIILLMAVVAISSSELINEDVERVIDLKSHLVKVTTTVTLKNSKGGPVTNFQFVVDPLHVKQLAHILFRQANDETIILKKVSSDPDNKSFVVAFPSKLGVDDTYRFVVEEVYVHTVNAFPKEISQSQNQLMVYHGNHFYYSPYVTETQTTTVELPTKTVESYSKFGSPDKEETAIKYGDSKEFENVAALSKNAMKIHYENNNPFLTVTEMTRVIEVSHWGNIAIEESIDIRHTGAKLKGSFSRYDYQRMQNSGVSSVKAFKTILPAAASDVYYRDEIGNISTSNLLQTEDAVELEIRPRFPLFGGWKTFYYFGYNLPSYIYLFIRGDLHGLKMRFVDHIMDDQLVEDFTLKIILPEGAKNIKVKTPYPVKRESDELHFTYLDTVGRPVIIMKKTNLVEQHIADFTLSYTFNRLLLLQEPMLITGAFFLLFFTVIIIVRLDFSIAYDQASEARMRVQSVIEQVQAHQAKRYKCYEAYEAAVTKYKAAKDYTSFSATRKGIEKTHKEATNAINQLCGKLREDAVDAADKEEVMKLKRSGKWKTGKKYFQTPLDAFHGHPRSDYYYYSYNWSLVGNLNQADSTLKDKISVLMQIAEKLVNKKMSREQYVDQSGKLQKSIEEMKEKTCEIADNLVA